MVYTASQEKNFFTPYIQRRRRNLFTTYIQRRRRKKLEVFKGLEERKIGILVYGGGAATPPGKGSSIELCFQLASKIVKNDKNLKKKQSQKTKNPKKRTKMKNREKKQSQKPKNRKN